MKLILQIALGVFVGALAAGLALDVWRDYRETQAKKTADAALARQQKARHEEGERVRAMLLQGRQNRNRSILNTQGSDFIPDHVQSPISSPRQD